MHLAAPCGRARLTSALGRRLKHERTSSACDPHHAKDSFAPGLIQLAAVRLEEWEHFSSGAAFRIDSIHLYPMRELAVSPKALRACLPNLLPQGTT